MVMSLPVQVTADGVPVVFHDDYVVHGSLVTPRRSLVSQLSADDFQKLPQLLRWFKDKITHLPVPCDHLWHCEQEDRLPTLQEVCHALPASVGLNVEIKMATSHALQQTPYAEVQRIVDPTIAVIRQCATSGREFVLSSFDPDVMAYCQACSAQLPSICTCWLLTEGTRAVLSADERRKSVSAAASFAKQHKLHGLVVESREAHAANNAVIDAMKQGLKVRCNLTAKAKDAIMHSVQLYFWQGRCGMVHVS